MEKNNLAVNDRTHPIEATWLLANSIPLLVSIPTTYLITIVATYAGSIQLDNLSSSWGFLFYGAIALLAPLLRFISNLITRATFHYSLDENFLLLKQGIINKQSRQLHYGVIQNLLITNNIFDRLLGLRTLTIQNASNQSFVNPNKQSEYAGFVGNTINIPGLSADNAKSLKEHLLRKIKSSPIIERGI